MIEVRRTTEARPDAVWDVLRNGWYYPTWVVGAARMRAVSGEWSAVGATLHHSVGGCEIVMREDACPARPA